MTEHRDKTLTQLKLIKKGIRRKATQITHNKPKDKCLWNHLPPFCLLLFLPEWDSALLWISGSGSSDFLESGSQSPSCTSRDAWGVADSTQRTTCRKSFDLCPLWALWPQLSGRILTSAGSEGGTSDAASRHLHRTPPGEAAAAR